MATRKERNMKRDDSKWKAFVDTWSDQECRDTLKKCIQQLMYAEIVRYREATEPEYEDEGPDVLAEEIYWESCGEDIRDN
jgi:hypothetical protein